MKVPMVKQKIACCLIALLAAPASLAYAGQKQDVAPQQVAAPSSEPQSTPLEARPQDSQQQSASNAPAADQQTGQAPVGTAAAPYEKASGITATRPAGAVIAPAKQRRVRQIFIKVGILAGAGAAVAAVALLSHSSPSTPR